MAEPAREILTGNRPDLTIIGPTREEAKEANAGRIKENRILSFIKKHPFLSSLFGLFGVGITGGYVTYQNSPEFHQRVDQLPTGVVNWWNSIIKHIGPQSIEDRFPVKLQSSDFAPTDREQVVNVYKRTRLIDPENHIGIIGFPLNQEVAQNNPNIRYNKFFDASAFSGVDVSRLERQGIKNSIQITGLAKGTIIYSPVEGSVIAVGVAGTKYGEGSQSFTPAYTTLRFMFRDKEDKNYEVTFSALQARPLINISPYPTGHHPVLEDGTRVQILQPILELTTDLQDWNGEGVAASNQRGQITISAISLYDPSLKAVTPTLFTPDFLRLPDGKIITPKETVR